MSVARLWTILCSALVFFVVVGFCGSEAHAQPGGFAHFEGEVTAGTGQGEQAVGSDASLTIGTNGSTGLVMVKLEGETIFFGSGPAYTPDEPYSQCLVSGSRTACIEIDEEGHGHVEVSDNQGNSVRIEF